MVDTITALILLTPALFGLSVLVLAPIGVFASPILLKMVNAAPAVQAEALPFLRVMMVFSSGMLIFYMLAGALRAVHGLRDLHPLRDLGVEPIHAGYARTVIHAKLRSIAQECSHRDRVLLVQQQ